MAFPQSQIAGGRHDDIAGLSHSAAVAGSFGGKTDAFLLAFGLDYNFLFSTYLGGSGEERAMAVASDRNGGW